MPPHGGHHGGGHRGGRGGGFRRGFGGRTVVLDYGPDYFDPGCVRVLRPDGTYEYRCPPTSYSDAMGVFRGGPYYLQSDTMGAGDILPTFVTPDDARKAIDETDAAYERFNLSVLASTTAPPEFKASWGVQYAGWKTFATGARATVGFLNTKAVMDQNDRYQAQLGDWSKSFALVGGVAPGPAPAAPGQGTGEPLTLGGMTGLLVAGAVLAAVVLIAPHITK